MVGFDALVGKETARDGATFRDEFVVQRFVRPVHGGGVPGRRVRLVAAHAVVVQTGRRRTHDVFEKTSRQRTHAVQTNARRPHFDGRGRRVFQAMQLAHFFAFLSPPCSTAHTSASRFGVFGVIAPFAETEQHRIVQHSRVLQALPALSATLLSVETTRDKRPTNDFEAKTNSCWTGFTLKQDGVTILLKPH